MRNFISHEYANIDEAIVFDVIKEDLPRMQEAVKRILNDYYLHIYGTLTIKKDV